MSRLAIAVRWNTLPLLHKIHAGALSLAVIAASLALPRHSSPKFRSSALLSFDPSAQGKPALPGEQSAKSAAGFAESILYNDAAGESAGQPGLRLSNPPGNRMAQYREHLTLTDIPPSTLSVTWQDDSPAQAISSANEGTQLLPSWAPAEIGPDRQQIPVSPSLAPSATAPFASKPHGMAAL